MRGRLRQWPTAPRSARFWRHDGLTIPEDTWFLAAKHITTSDRIEFYDLEDLPAGHRQDLQLCRATWQRAGAAQALERCGRLPGASASSPSGAWRHVNVRTMDWANTRPEWGLASNAAFIIGRRSLTKGLSLRGRAFLHSYHPDHDPEGAILEKIMTAPLIVGQWINMEHYFSAVDPWFWGSGSKVIHNVVSGVGVMLGSQSDLQTGLPLQTVNDGAAHYHEPVRLLTVIEAPTERISRAIGKHAILQGLFHNQWLNLVAIDPATLRDPAVPRGRGLGGASADRGRRNRDGRPGPSVNRPMLRTVAVRAVALFVVWLLLSQTLDVFYLGLGGLSALVVARLHTSEPATGGLRWAGLLLYLPWLLWQVLLSGWHVTRLILDPRLPIDPKLVTYKTVLRDPAAVTIFGNSITLTPGTITVEVNGDELVVHAMDDASAAGLGDMEKKIVRVFGGDTASASGPRP